MSKLVIAIDGPAGAGKTTVAKRLASDLGLRFLDTGAMYRCIAVKAATCGLKPEDGELAAGIAEKSEIDFGPGDPQRVFLDGIDVTEAIRKPDVGDFASAVSVHSAVRKALVKRQQDIVSKGGVVLEGRDTTTVVAPHADLKIYMTASIETRAQRRFKELTAKGEPVDLDHLRKQIEARDKRDSTREDSPLRVAEGAEVIDTDSMTIDDVVARVEELAFRP